MPHLPLDVPLIVVALLLVAETICTLSDYFRGKRAGEIPTEPILHPPQCSTNAGTLPDDQKLHISLVEMYGKYNSNALHSEDPGEYREEQVFRNMSGAEFRVVIIPGPRIESWVVYPPGCGGNTWWIYYDKDAGGNVVYET